MNFTIVFVASPFIKFTFGICPKNLVESLIFESSNISFSEFEYRSPIFAFTLNS